jgi:hypothetical protein
MGTPSHDGSTSLTLIGYVGKLTGIHFCPRVSREGCIYALSASGPACEPQMNVREFPSYIKSTKLFFLQPKLFVTNKALLSAQDTLPEGG